MTKGSASADDVNSLLYRALREFRNLVVDLVRRRLTEAYPDSWREHLFRGITEHELNSIRENLARTRGSGVVEPPVADDFDLVDIGHFRSIFEANRTVLVSSLDDEEMALLGRRFGELKTVRNPVAHPSERDLDTGDAIRALNTAKRVLDRLGLPSRTITPIFRQLWDIGAENQKSPVRPKRRQPVRKPPRPLPTLRIALRGRGVELTTLLAMLRKPGVGLVTITGIGGVGKTSLAVRAAEELAQLKGGPLVGFAELEELTGRSAVESEISAALGVRKLTEIPVDRDVVLLLDNFEHLLELRGMITDLVRARPRVRLLVTSRVALSLRGEHLVALTGLPFPAASTDVPLEDLTEFGAVALFCDRAHAANPGFRLTAAAAPHIVQLCQMVGGLPLSLEILARRVRSSPLAELPTEMSQVLGLENTADVPGRQRSLHATFLFSEKGLSADAITAWRRLSLFPLHDRWSARVACDLRGDMDGLRIDNAVDELVDASLLSLNSNSVLVMHPATAAFGYLRLEEAGETTPMAEHLADAAFNLARDSDALHDKARAQAGFITGLHAYHASEQAEAGDDYILKSAVAVQRCRHYLEGGEKGWEDLVPPLFELIAECQDASDETLSAAYRDFVDFELESEDVEADAVVICESAWKHAVDTGDTDLGVLVWNCLYDVPWLDADDEDPRSWVPWAEELLPDNPHEEQVSGACRLLSRALVLGCRFRSLPRDPIDPEYLAAIAALGVVVSQTMDEPEEGDYLICLSSLHLVAYLAGDFELIKEIARWPDPPSQDPFKIEEFRWARHAIRARILALGALYGSDGQPYIEELADILLEQAEKFLAQPNPTDALVIAGGLGTAKGLPAAQERRRQAIVYQAGEAVTAADATQALQAGVDQGLFGVVLFTFSGVEELIE